ncbi:cell division protein FtsB [Arenimonas sp.]|uniref:cell division protein FtsB n=1 Tax=Arenimonas sp. TaxID=1872635 RepID=UPI002E32CEDC|nr:cell division protein FtsB [Arenimonas sp.]HEX4854574.1 cell division protein FtsB [Arenimonas sp.]
MRRWWPFALLLLVLAGLQLKLWWGEGALGEARVLEERVADQRRENARLQQRNDALSAEVEDLKSGEAAVEDRARSELGMIKPGETFYRVVEPAGAPPPAAEAPRDAAAGDAE